MTWRAPGAPSELAGPVRSITFLVSRTRSGHPPSIRRGGSLFATPSLVSAHRPRAVIRQHAWFEATFIVTEFRSNSVSHILQAPFAIRSLCRIVFSMLSPVPWMTQTVDNEPSYSRAGLVPVGANRPGLDWHRRSRRVSPDIQIACDMAPWVWPMVHRGRLKGGVQFEQTGSGHDLIPAPLDGP